MRDLVEKPAAHERAEVIPEMPLFALAFGMTEAREQRPAIEHHRGVGGEYHVRQPGHAGHDLKPRPGSAKRCDELAEAAPGGGEMARGIRGPGAGPHPRVDRIGHREMRGIGQQQHGLQKQGGLRQQAPPCPNGQTSGGIIARQSVDE